MAADLWDWPGNFAGQLPGRDGGHSDGEPVDLIG
jgi:hypothetical protein